MGDPEIIWSVAAGESPRPQLVVTEPGRYIAPHDGVVFVDLGVSSGALDRKYPEDRVELVLSPGFRLMGLLVHQSGANLVVALGKGSQIHSLHVRESQQVNFECENLAISYVDLMNSASLQFSDSVRLGRLRIASHAYVNWVNRVGSTGLSVGASEVKQTVELAVELLENRDWLEISSTSAPERRCALNVGGVQLVVGRIAAAVDFQISGTTLNLHAGASPGLKPVDKQRLTVSGSGIVRLGDWDRRICVGAARLEQSLDLADTDRGLWLEIEEGRYTRQVSGRCNVRLSEGSRLRANQRAGGLTVLRLRGCEQCELQYVDLFQLSLRSLESLRNLERLELIWPLPEFRRTRKLSRNVARRATLECSRLGLYHRGARRRLSDVGELSVDHSEDRGRRRSNAHRWVEISKVVRDKGTSASNYLMARELSFEARRLASTGAERLVLSASSAAFGHGCRVLRPFLVWAWFSLWVAVILGQLAGQFEVLEFAGIDCLRDPGGGQDAAALGMGRLACVSLPGTWSIESIQFQKVASSWIEVFLLPFSLLRAPIPRGDPSVLVVARSATRFVIAGAHVAGLLCVGSILLAVSRTFGRSNKLSE